MKRLLSSLLLVALIAGCFTVPASADADTVADKLISGWSVSYPTGYSTSWFYYVLKELRDIETKIGSSTAKDYSTTLSSIKSSVSIIDSNTDNLSSIKTSTDNLSSIKSTLSSMSTTLSTLNGKVSASGSSPDYSTILDTISTQLTGIDSSVDLVKTAVSGVDDSVDLVKTAVDGVEGFLDSIDSAVTSVQSTVSSYLPAILDDTGDILASATHIENAVDIDVAPYVQATAASVANIDESTDLIEGHVQYALLPTVSSLDNNFKSFYDYLTMGFDPYAYDPSNWFYYMNENLSDLYRSTSYEWMNTDYDGSWFQYVAHNTDWISSCLIDLRELFNSYYDETDQLLDEDFQSEKDTFRGHFGSGVGFGSSQRSSAISDFSEVSTEFTEFFDLDVDVTGVFDDFTGLLSWFSDDTADALSAQYGVSTFSLEDASDTPLLDENVEKIREYFGEDDEDG